jgi:hypothetical protein
VTGGGAGWQVTNRMFLAVWFTGVPTSMGAIAVFALNLDFLAIRREIKNGSFSPWSYIVSNALFQARARPTAPPPLPFLTMARAQSPAARRQARLPAVAQLIRAAWWPASAVRVRPDRGAHIPAARRA